MTLRSLASTGLSSAFALSLLACGGASMTPADAATGGGASPAIKITSPMAGASVVANANMTDVDIAFTVTNFTLKAPGTCAGMMGCGHVHLLVDGTDCNDPGAAYDGGTTGAKPYNNAGASSPISAGLDYCMKGIDGMHTAVVELHNDDHSPVTDSSGKPVSDSVTFTATAM